MVYLSVTVSLAVDLISMENATTRISAYRWLVVARTNVVKRSLVDSAQSVKTLPADLFQELETMTVVRMLNVSHPIVHPLLLLLALIFSSTQSVMKSDNVSSLMVMVSPNVTVYLVVEMVTHTLNAMKKINVFW